MMAGFVYACARKDDYGHIKIGFTTQNPHKYMQSQSRLLSPLQVISITAFANARLAESNVFHALNRQRLQHNRELFNLDYPNGMSDFQQAIDGAQKIDELSKCPVPEIPSTEQLEQRHHRKHLRHQQKKDDAARKKKDKKLWALAIAIHREKHSRWMQSYCNTKLQEALDRFLKERCQVGLSINAAEFRAAFIEDSGQKVRQVDLKKAMTKHGYHYKVAWISGHTSKVYAGLHIKSNPQM